MKAVLNKKCPNCNSLITIEDNKEIFTEPEIITIAGEKTFANTHYKTTCIVCKTKFTLWIQNNYSN
jgi:hypothetical protein